MDWNYISESKTFIQYISIKRNAIRYAYIYDERLQHVISCDSYTNPPFSVMSNDRLSRIGMYLIIELENLLLSSELTPFRELLLFDGVTLYFENTVGLITRLEMEMD